LFIAIVKAFAPLNNWYQSFGSRWQMKKKSKLKESMA